MAPAQTAYCRRHAGIRDTTTHSISLGGNGTASGVIPEQTAAAGRESLRLSPRVGKPLRGCPACASDTQAAGNPHKRGTTARQDNTDKHRTRRVQRDRLWSPILSLHLSWSSPSMFFGPSGPDQLRAQLHGSWISSLVFASFTYYVRLLRRPPREQAPTL